MVFGIIPECRSASFRIERSASPESPPCSVGLVLDISGSMQNALSAAKDVTHTFLRTANPDDEFLLLTVSTQPGAVSGFTTDTTALEESIELTRPAGLTALIDTVYLGLSDMRRAKQPRRALLILSDGMDNRSRYSKSELLRVALEADVQVYAIIVETGSAGTSNTIPFRPALIRKPWDRPQEAQGPALLEELSEKTGGLHFRVTTIAEANEAVTKISQALRNEYVIGYQPPESQSAGKWHRVRVKSDVPKVNIHARNGYYSQ